MSSLDTSVHETVTDFSRNQWNSLVRQSRTGNVFHHYEWLLSCENGLDVEGKYIVVTKKGNPIAVFPNFQRTTNVGCYLETLQESTLWGPAFETLPSQAQPPSKQLHSFKQGYGGPIITSNETESLSLLLRKLNEVCRDDISTHIIFTDYADMIRYGEPLEENGYRAYLDGCSHFLDISPPDEEILRSMDKELRNVDKYDYDVQLEELHADSVGATYDAYRKNTERAGGNPVPISFFEALAEHMDDRLRIAKVTVGDTVVGRDLLFLDDVNSAIHMFYSAIPDEKYFKYCPHVMAIRHLGYWGKENGYDRIDLAPTKANPANSTFKYKTKMGGKVVPRLKWEKNYTPFWSKLSSGLTTAKDVFKSL